LFCGEHHKSLDDKDRIIIPARIRKALESAGEAEPAPEAAGEKPDPAAFVLTMPPGPNKCISLYPADYFNRIFLPFNPEDAFTDPEVQVYARKIGARTRHVACDKQGRLHVPPALRERCGMGREVVLVGAIDHVEIWDAKAWNRYDLENEALASVVATRIYRRDRSQDAE
jgi:MraZ protein